jgi:hypothetical protein
MQVAKEVTKERNELANGICGEIMTSWKRKLRDENGNEGDLLLTPMQGGSKKREVSDKTGG